MVGGQACIRKECFSGTQTRDYPLCSENKIKINSSNKVETDFTEKCNWKHYFSNNIRPFILPFLQQILFFEVRNDLYLVALVI